MSTRIRYTKTDVESVLMSARSFTVGDQNYRVRLDQTDMSFCVLNLQNNVVACGNATTMSSLKIKAKKELVTLGVNFEKESRGCEECATTCNQCA